MAMWLKFYAVLLVVAAGSFVLSNALLEGPDPEGWWNFLPAIIFYGAVFVAFVLPVALAIRELVWLLLSRLSGDRATNT